MLADAAHWQLEPIQPHLPPRADCNSACGVPQRGEERTDPCLIKTAGSCKTAAFYVSELRARPCSASGQRDNVAAPKPSSLMDRNAFPAPRTDPLTAIGAYFRDPVCSGAGKNGRMSVKRTAGSCKTADRPLVGGAADRNRLSGFRICKTDRIRRPRSFGRSNRNVFPAICKQIP